MKILTICQAGLCRSVAAAAYFSKERLEVEVIPAGVGLSSPYTLLALYSWADKIVVVAEEHIKKEIPTQFQDKITHIDIGPDIWGAWNDPKLTKLLETRLKEIMW